MHHSRTTHNDNPKITTYIHKIVRNKRTRFNFFSSLDPNTRAAVFNDLPVATQQDFLDRAPIDLLVRLLDHFDHQYALRYIRRIHKPKRRKEITHSIRSELKEKVEHFRRFHPKTADNIVHFNYILIPHNKNIGDVADAVDDHYEETGKLPEVLIRKDGKCIGQIPPGVLIRESNTTAIESFIRPVVTIPYTMPAPEIINTALSSGAQKMIVLDTDESIVGVTYTKDVLNLVDEHPLESLYDFIGLEETERPFDTAEQKILSRWLWLLINLGTVFLGAAVIGYFHETLDHLVLLAMYIPVIVGMGSNAGAQTLAVFVRGIALGEIRLQNSIPAVRNELIAVSTQSIFYVLIITLIGMLLGHGFMLGITVGFAVMVNLLIGVLMGAYLPLLTKFFGKDPALSSSIILTTFTDVCGLIALFGFAQLFLL